MFGHKWKRVKTPFGATALDGVLILYGSCSAQYNSHRKPRCSWYGYFAADCRRHLACYAF